MSMQEDIRAVLVLTLRQGKVTKNESSMNHKNDSLFSGLMSETVAGIQSQIETLKNDVIEASSKIPSEVTLVTIKDQGMVQKRHFDVIHNYVIYLINDVMINYVIRVIGILTSVFVIILKRYVTIIYVIARSGCYVMTDSNL